MFEEFLTARRAGIDEDVCEVFPDVVIRHYAPICLNEEQTSSGSYSLKNRGVKCQQRHDTDLNKAPQPSRHSRTYGLVNVELHGVLGPI